MGKVLVIGGTTYDSIIYLKNLPAPEPQTIHYAPFYETLGSTGAGKSLNLTRLNVDNTLHSILGDDMYGERIIKGLKDAGVDFIYDFDPKGTERHVNLMDGEGRRISIFVTQSSPDPDLDMAGLEKYITACDLIVLNIIGYTRRLIPLIAKHNKPVWTDLHDYDLGNPYHEAYIEAADYIFLSSDNLKDYRAVMKEWMAKGKELIVCTHGEEGSTALTKEGKWIETPVINYPFVDANGAGDSFFAGYIYGFLKGRPVEDCLKFGTICAGLCISSRELASPELSEALLAGEYEKHYA